jgi:hypothetical protein
MQQPACRNHMSCAPAKELDDTVEGVYSEVNSCNWL